MVYSRYWIGSRALRCNRVLTPYDNLMMASALFDLVNVQEGLTSNLRERRTTVSFVRLRLQQLQSDELLTR